MERRGHWSYTIDSERLYWPGLQGSQREQFRRASCRRQPAQKPRAASTAIHRHRGPLGVSASCLGISGAQMAFPDQERSALAQLDVQGPQLLAVDAVASTHDDHDGGQGAGQAALSLEPPQEA